MDNSIDLVLWVSFLALFVTTVGYQRALRKCRQELAEANVVVAHQAAVIQKQSDALTAAMSLENTRRGKHHTGLC